MHTTAARILSRRGTAILALLALLSIGILLLPKSAAWLVLAEFLVLAAGFVLVIQPLIEAADSRLHRALAQEEERFRAFMDHSPFIASIKDGAGRYVYANRSFEQFFRLRADQVAGKRDSELWSEEIASRLSDRDAEILAGAEGLEQIESFHDADGAVRQWLVLKFPVHAPDGALLLGSVAVDRTEARQAQDALRESEERYRVLCESASDAIVTVDEERNIRFANRAAENIFGYAWAEMVGQPLHLLLPKNLRPAEISSVKEYIDRRTEQAVWKTLEIPGRHKTGRELTCEISFAEFRRGEEIYYTAIIRDVTQRKRADEARERLIRQFEDALAKIKTLSGLLPICASCKKVRDDRGYWEQIETYVQHHTEAVFSHSICPDCTQRLYPELYAKQEDH